MLLTTVRPTPSAAPAAPATPPAPSAPAAPPLTPERAEAAQFLAAYPSLVMTGVRNNAMWATGDVSRAQLVKTYYDAKNVNAVIEEAVTLLRKGGPDLASREPAVRQAFEGMFAVLAESAADTVKRPPAEAFALFAKPFKEVTAPLLELASEIDPRQGWRV